MGGSIHTIHTHTAVPVGGMGSSIHIYAVVPSFKRGICLQIPVIRTPTPLIKKILNHESVSIKRMSLLSLEYKV